MRAEILRNKGEEQNTESFFIKLIRAKKNKIDMSVI